MASTIYETETFVTEPYVGIGVGAKQFLTSHLAPEGWGTLQFFTTATECAKMPWIT